MTDLCFEAWSCAASGTQGHQAAGNGLRNDRRPGTPAEERSKGGFDERVCRQALVVVRLVVSDHRLAHERRYLGQRNVASLIANGASRSGLRNRGQFVTIRKADTVFVVPDQPTLDDQ